MYKSITVVSIEPARYKDGEMVSGPSQSSETEPYRSPEQLQNKINSLQIRHSYYQGVLIPLNAEITSLVVAGKSKDGAIHFLFVNTGANVPTIGV